MNKNKLKNIERIDILTDSCIWKDINEKELYNCLVIAMKNNKQLIYNLNKSIDYSFESNKRIYIQEDITNIYNFYESDVNAYYELDFYELESIKLYKNIRLKKIDNNDLSCKTNLIEFKDINNNKFYISYLSNEIFISEKDYQVIRQKNTKTHNIYIKDSNIELDFSIFYS